jgi:3-hydroxypropanoate dehydrogenase
MKSSLNHVAVSKFYRAVYRNYSLVEAFEVISRNRHAEKNFSAKGVNDATVRKIVELTQLAPTSFNIQPYKIVLVKSEEMKSMVATAMSPGNDRHVKAAAYTAIFAADKG